MSDGGRFDPEATMAGFEARRGLNGTEVTPPHEPLGPARRTRPRRATRLGRSAPPFGSLRGSRVTYTLYLPRDLADRLDGYLGANGGTRTSLGATAVAAIRAHWRVLQQNPVRDRTDIFTPDPVEDADRAAAQLVRRVFYVTDTEADAIELVRLQLGGLDLRSLHVNALELMLESQTPETP